MGTVEGLTLEISRRHIRVLAERGAILHGTVASKALDVVIGDKVEFEQRENGKAFVIRSKPSQRSLYRSYRSTVKRICANVDNLFIVTAPGETFNPGAIDRLIVAGRLAAIPLTLVINKSDLKLDAIHPEISTYERIGVSVLLTSAKFGGGLDGIFEIIKQSDVHIVALCGVSGVGKSTILNKLVPGAGTKTGDLSERTGQGRQTTTQPRGFIFQRESGDPAVIVDLPGIQYFGLAHLDVADVAAGFDEFSRFRNACRFQNCRHLLEPECGVRAACERGEISERRYQSYVSIIQEVQAGAKF